jgi:hypothetical protein
MATRQRFFVQQGRFILDVTPLCPERAAREIENIVGF